MTETYDRPVPPKRGTSPFVLVGLGCALLLFGIGLFAAFVMFVVVGSMRSSMPYQDAVRRAQSDPRVITMLGEPMEVGWFISGTIKITGASGSANLAIPLHGPRGKATIHAIAEKRRRDWHFTQLIVTPEAGDEVDLLNVSTRESPDTSPRAE